MIRTTITLDDDVAAKHRAAMRQSGKSFKEIVNETLRAGLLKAPAPAGKRFKVRAKHIGLKPGYSYDKSWELIEQIGGPGYK